MKVQVNQEELKREWVLNKWYEKTCYVFGLIMFFYLALAFLVGFMAGLIEEL